MIKYKMLTPYANNFKKESPLKEYPRPHLRRGSFLNLNGLWDFEITNSESSPLVYSKIITVPYSPESYLSSIRKDINKEYLHYRLDFMVDSNFIKDLTMLHFGAINQEAKIYLNGYMIKESNNGYLPIDIDISSYLKVGSNELKVVVRNLPNIDSWVGKAGNKRGGMWYTKSSGIWQTVWLESFSKQGIKDLVLKPNYDEKKVIVSLKSNYLKGNYYIYDLNKLIIEGQFQGDSFEITFDDIIKWDLDNPFLYKIVFNNSFDEVESYFAFRKVEIKDRKIYLNDQPVFINGVLDQGYYSDGIYTPASYQAYYDDLKTIKDLGFNAVRKHVKVEPEIFYYTADILGVLVLQDVPNSGKYRFYHDTFWPNLGFIYERDTHKQVSERRKINFTNDCRRLVKALAPHPSVIYYTIFNEGWGQFDSDYFYRLFKEIALDYIIDSTSGWFWQIQSDVLSIHTYFFKVRIPKSCRQPVILSEFGGYSLKVNDHLFNDKKSYGYKTFIDEEAFTDNLIKLYERDVISNIDKGLAGAIYTQLSDVEDEINGLLTYDRQKLKVNGKKLKTVLSRVKY